jgi:hypothetical protein
MMEKKMPELSPKEHRRGLGLVRRCDAFLHARLALEGEWISEEDRQNALAVVRGLSEAADTALLRWKRDHGIPED